MSIHKELLNSSLSALSPAHMNDDVSISDNHILLGMSKQKDDTSIGKSLRQFIEVDVEEKTSQLSSQENISIANNTIDNNEKISWPIYPKSWKELMSLFPGVLMVLLFGYTYVAIVISGNPQLQNHAGFFLCWIQISNIAITLSAGFFGSTKWVVGGANTTSAIMLKVLLQDANIETALFIQGCSSLFTAILFLGIAQFGGLGRLFGDRNVNIALYADYIHPSLVMALSHATALLMIKYSWELSVRSNLNVTSTITINSLQLIGEWFCNLLQPDAISVWVPGWIIGGISAYVDLQLRKQMMAMTILFILPLVTFISIVTTMGLDVIPSYQYWNIESSAIETFQNLDFRKNINFMEIFKKIPLSILGAIVIFIEAQAVYKSFSVVVPERRSIKKDNISCGIAHIVIGCLGGWFGHQVCIYV